MINSVFLASLLAVGSCCGVVASDRRNTATLPFNSAGMSSVVINYQGDASSLYGFQSFVYFHDIDIVDDTFFDAGFIFYPVSFTFDVSGSSFDLSIITFAKINYPYTAQSLQNLPFFGMYETTNTLNFFSKMQWKPMESKADFVNSSWSCVAMVSQAVFASSAATTTSGPYQFGMPLAGWSLFEQYAAYVYSMVNADNFYREGETYGYDNGFYDGKQTGYAQGIQTANSVAGSFEKLFGAVVTVPVQVFNGMSSAVLWGVPVISLIFTFTAIGLVIFIIKKVFL